MSRLFDRIRGLVREGRYIVGLHASERLEERGVLEWQVVDGIETAELLADRPDAQPNPAIETRQSLADGSQIKAVWSHISSADVAKLVTIHFLNE